MRQIVAGLALLATLGNVGACDRDDSTTVNVNPPGGPTPVVRNTAIFRVTGNASSVRVRYSNPTDGLLQVVTALPYSAAYSSTADSIFLSLEATPLSFPFAVTHPFTSAQIYVNDTLFREASSNDFLSSTLFVSGTWRR
jgi:hypothetical protein